VILKLAGGLTAATLTVALLPFLMVPGAGGPDVAAGPGACGPIGVILDTIRTQESGNNYTARASGSSASGAYQFIDSTWRWLAEKAGVDVARYPAAWMAPPPDQDATATVYVNEILANHNQQIDVIPVTWYYPAALTNPALMDIVPVPEAGNTLTVRQYQLRWMNTYQQKLGAAGLESSPENPTASCAGSVSPDGQWALPAPRDVLARAGISEPHHDYPAVDLMMAEGVPVYAITAGTVARTARFNANWYKAGCPRPGCSTCGMGITIQSPTGLRHTYCHNTVLHVNEGDQIAPGQHIADSGDTGRSGAPHLHLELRINNIQHCPQPLLEALYNNQPTIPDPATLPTRGCTF